MDGLLVVMGVPACAASAATWFLILRLFPLQGGFTINPSMLQEKLAKMRHLTEKEKRTAVWIFLAVAAWSTDALHHLDIGWITLAMAMCMSMPLIGEVAEAGFWKDVPLEVLLFVTAATAIGKVGASTGMNDWLAEVLLPTGLPTNIWIAAMLIMVVSVILHMLLGEV